MEDTIRKQIKEKLSNSIKESEASLISGKFSMSLHTPMTFDSKPDGLRNLEKKIASMLSMEYGGNVDVRIEHAI